MDLLKIELDDSDFNKIGRPNSARLLSRRIIQDLSIAALRTFQSVVPVDTGELRREDIELSNVTDSEATVVVKDVPHFGRSKKSISASRLAQILQEGHGRRTKDSQVDVDITSGLTIAPQAKGTPTSGWITKGQEAFNALYKKYLESK